MFSLFSVFSEFADKDHNRACWQADISIHTNLFFLPSFFSGLSPGKCFFLFLATFIPRFPHFFHLVYRIFSLISVWFLLCLCLKSDLDFLKKFNALDDGSKYFWIISILSKAEKKGEALIRKPDSGGEFLWKISNADLLQSGQSFFFSLHLTRFNIIKLKMKKKVASRWHCWHCWTDGDSKLINNLQPLFKNVFILIKTCSGWVWKPQNPSLSLSVEQDTFFN